MLRRRHARCDSSPKRTRRKTQRFRTTLAYYAPSRAKAAAGKRCGTQGVLSRGALPSPHHGGCNRMGFA